jgi:hypothetical protein
MPNARLQQAFETLMQRAPSALFKRARSLYLSKYPLDGRDTTSNLRLFVSKEHIDEQIVAGGSEGERLAVVSIKPIELTLVHWQQPDPASVEVQRAYFREQWGIDLPTLHPLAESWFREGGHQSTLVAPQGLQWVRSSPMPSSDNPGD